MSKHCAFPGCTKELPDGTKLALCEYHRDKGKENAVKAGAAVGAAVLTGVTFVAKGGVKAVKKAGPAAKKAVQAALKFK